MKFKLLAVVILLCLLSCSFIDSDSIDENEDLVQFDEELYWSQYNKWIDAEYHSYEFLQEYSNQIDGPQPEVKIVVSNNEFVSFELVDDRFVLEEGEEYEVLFYETVDEIFIRIYDLYEIAKESVKSSSVTSAHVNVIYDEEYHYPKEIHCGERHNVEVNGDLSIYIIINDFYLTDSDEYININFDEDLYLSNYDKWVEYGYHNYEFTQEFYSGAYGPLPEVRIVVSNNQFNSLTLIDNVEELDEDDIVYYETIDDIYEKIYSSYEYYKTVKKSSDSHLVGVSISVEYDEIYNYPKDVSFSGSYNTSIDGGIYTTVSINDFSPVE